MRSYKYPLRSFKVVCGGETPEARHERIQSDLMDREQKRMNKERFDDPIIMSGTKDQQIENLIFAVGTYEQDLAFYRRHTKELEQKIRQLEMQIKNS
jgi:hypothetical protein